MCTVINFSFARMRKKYIENNDELDTELVKKVAPYYKKTSEVIAGTQIGHVLCSGLFMFSLYRVMTELSILVKQSRFMVTEGLLYGSVAFLFVAFLLLFWIFTLLLPASVSLVRPLPMLASHIWFLKILSAVFKPFTRIGLYAVKKILDMRQLPFRDEVNFTYTEDEIRCIVEESHRSGRLNALENTLIKNSFDFFDLDARDVMIPRNKMVVLDFDNDMDEMRRIISKAHHTCYPVCLEDKDHMLGFIHVKDFLESLLRGEYNIKRIMREILTVPEVMPAAALLKLMKNRRIYLAVVVDEYGSTSGLVTLEDLTEELVGALPQNEDPAPMEILAINDSLYEFDGTVILDDVFEKLEIALTDEERNNTIGGFVFSHLERIPKVGDHIVFGGWCFTVLRMDGFRVVRVRAERAQRQENNGDDVPGDKL